MRIKAHLCTRQNAACTLWLAAVRTKEHTFMGGATQRAHTLQQTFYMYCARGHCARAQLQPEDPAAKCCACARLLAAVHGVHDFMSHKITHASVTLHFLPSPYTQIVHGIKMQGLHNTGSKVAGSNLNVLPKAASRP
eukprot:scaffold115168_cov17-Tisochrysis_lutea.AAC.1